MAKKSVSGQANESETRKVIVKKRKEFLEMKDFLMRRGDFFLYGSSGSIDSIIYKDAEYMCVDLGQSGGRGHHLSRRFKRDIDNWLAERGGQIPKHEHNYREQMFNLQAIEKAVHSPALGIDANDCYWKTAHNLGYITDETYIVGLKKKEWKVGRNACIGSLKKSKMLVPYSNGKPNYKMKTYIPSRIEYQYVRNHIIGHVYDMFFRLYQEIGDKFYMFLTDCVFTDYEHRKYVQDFLMDYGYRSKCHPIDFTGVDRGKRKVSWYDFNEPVVNSEGLVTGKGKNKYYMYSYSQVVDGLAEPSPLLIAALGNVKNEKQTG